MFQIEMLPAQFGDSLWVEYGSPRDRRRVLIDGGTAPTYEILRERLSDLPRNQRRFELVVISHVDADHIEGVIRLLGDDRLGLQVEDVWFNGWRHLNPPPGDMLGPVQGEFLSALIRKRGLPWNVAFNGNAVVVPKVELPVIALPGGLQITLLSPNAEALAKLRRVWQREVKRNGLDPDEPEAALRRLATRKALLPADALGDQRPNVQQLASKPYKPDQSLANGSSIAFLAEYEGKRVLFAADALPATLEESLQRMLAGFGADRLPVQALKIAHHGGRKNLSADLLKLLICPRYLVSTNGDRYTHPHQESISRILIHGGNRKEIFFNYRTNYNLVWNDHSLKARYGYQAFYPPGDRPGSILEL
jgi:beta-lactamase superfamily II metal-dependent hydrolase